MKLKPDVACPPQLPLILEIAALATNLRLLSRSLALDIFSARVLQAATLTRGGNGPTIGLTFPFAATRTGRASHDAKAGPY